MSDNISRRELLKATGALAVTRAPSFPNSDAPHENFKIRGKKLLERGEPEWYSGSELRYIGMPVGGLFAGTVYLGGDGQLWNWDIFNQERLGCIDRPETVFMGDTLTAMGGANYVAPVTQQSPFKQEFRIQVEGDRPRRVKFGDIRFRGEYPVGKVQYRASDSDIEVDLEAFSPFCPLDAESSSFPATTQTFTVKNVGKIAQTIRLSYESENPSLIYSRKSRRDFQSKTEQTATGGLLFSASPLPPNPNLRREVLFEDWSSGTYGSWQTTGTAFGSVPQKVSELPSYMGPVHAETAYVVNSHQTRNGEDVVKADQHIGTLRSPEFAISRNYINLRVGGGNHKGGTCVNLLVDGQVVRTVTGRNSNVMNWESFDVREFAGKQAAIEVVDQVAGGWGQVSLGEVTFADVPKVNIPVEKLADFGSFCVEIVGGGSNARLQEVFTTISVAPGESKSVTFVIAWHFPNCARNLPEQKHWYASKWKDAADVAQNLISRWPELQQLTRKWNRTWYDSTLPYWFLDRTFVNTSILATTTCFRFSSGRYYFWEGVGCCAGTCTHVWGYAQAIGRVFPEIERYLRQSIDFGMAYRKDSGAIDYRAEYHQTVAVDGQCGCILRAYREHQMSNSDEFLRSIWPQIKGAMNCIRKIDTNGDGLLDAAQYNTLDTAWYGEISWISTLYLAALSACEGMARELGEIAYANECRSIIDKGSKNLVERLFNGEYFVNRADTNHPEANNTNIGCHIDQLYGLSWAHQAGLPRFIPSGVARTALRNLYKNNFFEDVWEYRRHNKAIPGGRWYAAPGEAGLIMCTFPKGGAAESVGKGADAWAVGYFNECMSGFEYQAAHHMISEGLIEEGLTVVRAIHERYHASKRNPYNEVECSDHYGRAMASYGAYVSLTGFRTSRGKNGFHNSVHSKPLRCAFIDALGWGTVESGSETYHYKVNREPK